MASGILGQSALAASTNTTVYTVPANPHSVVNVNVLNRSATAPALMYLYQNLLFWRELQYL